MFSEPIYIDNEFLGTTHKIEKVWDPNWRKNY